MEKYTDEQIIECYLKYNSSIKAGNELNISPSTICQVLKAHGIARDGRKNNSGKKMAKHGTRTMYQHYKCRCDACCRAEHKQYLKRKETQARRRVNSKWNDELVEYVVGGNRINTQRVHNANRYRAFKERPSTHKRPITWREIVKKFDAKCAICGCDVDERDTWISANGRRCFGRKYPTVDHIIPLKLGGSDTIENVQLTCKHCNSAKGAKIEYAC